MNLTQTILLELRATSHAPRTKHRALRTPRSALRTFQAFSLVEILVTVALLSFIILGLFAVFNQVQRAFRGSMNQVDQLEAGRAATEMLPRELEETTPCGANAVTFYTQIIPSPAPLTQALPGPGTTPMRVNLLQDCFMLVRSNQTWIGIGYCVRNSDANGRLYPPDTGAGQMGIGTLYRFSASTNVLRSDGLNTGLPSDPSQLYVAFRNACVPGSPAISNRICDGVIHFCLQAFATNGFPIVGNGVRTNAYFRADALTVPPRYSIVHPAQAVANFAYPGNVAGLCFWSNAVPAAVELQLGILEQRALERYNSIANPAARLAYLQRSETTSRIQLFRQRVPIRNVDPLAYQ